MQTESSLDAPAEEIDLRVAILVKGRLFGEAIVLGLNSLDNLAFVVSLDDGNPLKHIEHAQPGVVLIDASLAEAVFLAKAVRERVPDVRLVVLAAEGSDEDFLAWARIGISGYVEPNASIEDLKETLYRSGAGEVLCAPRLTGKLLDRFAALASTRVAIRCSHGLTHREREVLELLDQGCCNKVIARRLDISNSTVKNHVHTLLEKLGVQNRGQAASLFRRDEAYATSHHPGFSRNAGTHRASRTVISNDLVGLKRPL